MVLSKVLKNTLLIPALFVSLSPLTAATPDSRDNASPWGIAPGAETGGYFERLNPMLKEVGVRWIRMFPAWQNIERTQGQWNWDAADKRLASARANGIHLTGGWWYFSSWASADGGTRKGPIKDMQFWRDYVGATVQRYHNDIKYWEVWNEFNGGFYVGKDKVKDYADFVVAAYDTAKKIDPTVCIGMSVASSDIGFLDQVIKAGAANHFDYICIHPYENLSTLLYGDDAGYLSLGNSLRQMLASNHQRTDIPFWITEVGSTAPDKPDPAGDNVQADALIKAYIFSLAQGFQRVLWFEARGPDYSPGKQYGIIRDDWSKRPSFNALKTTISLLGETPAYIGWVDFGQTGYGLMFQGKDGPVLVVSTPIDAQCDTAFPSAVRVTDRDGKQRTLAANAPVSITSAPLFITSLPEATLAEARANKDRPFPWDGNFSSSNSVSCRFGDTNVNNGLRQVLLRKDHEGRTEPATVDGETCRRVVGKDKDGDCCYLRASASFAPFDAREFDITVVARRAEDGQPGGLAITYETPRGYQDFKKGGEPWTIPPGGWQTHTWHVKDACFANDWGWHLGLLPASDTSGFYIKEVKISKPGVSVQQEAPAGRE